MIRVLADIERRKQGLIERSAVQRASIVLALHGLERPAGAADRVLGVVRSLRAHPVLAGAVVAAVVAAVAWRRGKVVGLAARALAAWRTWRTISAWARRLGVEFPRSRRQQKAGHAAP